MQPQAVPVEELGITSDEAVWLGKPASRALEAEAHRAGLQLGQSGDIITLSAGAVATAEALAGFRRATDAVDGDAVGMLAGAIGEWGDWRAFGPQPKLIRLRGGGELTAQRLGAATEVEVPIAEPREVTFPLADRPGGREVTLVLANEVLCSTHHYSGLLWANLLALTPALWRTLLGTNVAVALLRSVWAWLRVRSTDPFVLAGALNHIEKGARIHPSAVVEASWIGEGARIGAGAVVRGCILGAGASVEPMALAQFSVMGPSSHLQRMGWMHFSLLHEGAAHAGAMQLGVLGPGASSKGVSVLMDQGVGTEIRVQRDGVLHPVPLGLMGVGVGRDSMIGSGVLVAPGRTVPPGVSILPPAGHVLMSIPQGIEGTARVTDGGLERIS